jgi:hypothetical protein
MAGTTVTPDPADTFDPAAAVVNGASLHGKLFLACKSDVNRLHVFDGTTLRRTGLAAPAAPSVADTGSGSFSGTRQYRVRYVAMSGTTILRRSEPSAATTFVPSGAGAAARITKPAAINEGETHWEIEESVDGGANFYRIVRVVVGTTTYDDALSTTDVPLTGVLSADIGDYSLQPSYRKVIVDRDRVLGLGNLEDATKDSRVEWSPVGSDTSGVGNDERVPTDTGNFVDLDGQDGGGITDGAAFETQILVFKQHRTYVLTQTGIRQSAYLPSLRSGRIGAMPGSVVEGVDEAGRPALYFVDAAAGPCRYGSNGIEVIAPQMQRRFRSELDRTGVYKVSAVFHQDKKQVWWSFTETGKTLPSVRWVYDTRQGVGRGLWRQTHPQPAIAMVMWQGQPHGATEDGIVRYDEPDAEDDYGTAFRGYVRTRAYELGNLVKRATVQAGILEALALAGGTVQVSIVRDYGKERLDRTAALDPTAANETHVIVPLDSLSMADVTAVQFEIGDAEAVATAPWQVDRMAVPVGAGSTNVGGA